MLVTMGARSCNTDGDSHGKGLLAEFLLPYVAAHVLALDTRRKVMPPQPTVRHVGLAPENLARSFTVSHDDLRSCIS